MEPQDNKPAAGLPEVRIEKWVYGGAGLARPEGRVTMVPFVLPDELVGVEIEREKPGLAEARLVEIVEPSPVRIAPECEYFTRCGGCHYQHAPYEYQLEKKAAILREVLQRVGKFSAPDEISIVAGDPWQYRNRSQFRIDGGKLGYFAPQSHDVVDVRQCPISEPAINNALARFREMMGDRRFPRFLRAVEFFTNGEQTLLNVLEREGDKGIARGFFEWAGENIPGADSGQLTIETASDSFRVSHGSFFQVNRYLYDELVQAALEGAEGETALDLYAGVGLFTLPLARKFQQVSAVETDASAARDLETNASHAKLTVDVHRLQSEQYLAQLTEAPDFVLADPPRSGLGKNAVKALVRLKPKRIHIVSCDPSTLARDLATILGAGYELEHLTMIDLFPQTFHLETVARLKLKND